VVSRWILPRNKSIILSNGLENSDDATNVQQP